MNVPSACSLDCEEAFGPVCVVSQFSDFKVAIEKVNESAYGLQAGVFTGELRKAFYAYENIIAVFFLLYLAWLISLFISIVLLFWRVRVYLLMLLLISNVLKGGVVINDVPSARIDSMPYGGVKDSGLGREGVRSTMEDYTETRVMLMKDNSLL